MSNGNEGFSAHDIEQFFMLNEVPEKSISDRLPEMPATSVTFGVQPDFGPSHIKSVDELHPGMVIAEVSAQDGNTRYLGIVAVGYRYPLHHEVASGFINKEEFVADNGCLTVAGQSNPGGEINPGRIFLEDVTLIPMNETDSRGPMWNGAHFLRYLFEDELQP